MNPAGVMITELEAMAIGRRTLHQNLLAAGATGTLLLFTGLFGWGHWLLGLLVAVLYSNSFEYVYHRFLLHRGDGEMTSEHRQHHDSFGQPHEPLHVNFGDSPVNVAMLIVANSLPFALLDWLGAGIGAGVVLGFVVYYMAYEVIHWRIHLGWLPRWLESIRAHHFAHHKGVPGHYNVFLPICDRLFR